MIDAEHFRSLLEDERDRILRQMESRRAEIASIEATLRDLHVDDQNPEGASTLFEISQETSLLAHQTELLGEINEALARITDGTYGNCLECRQPIPQDRLEARAWTGYCIDHAIRHRPRTPQH